MVPNDPGLFAHHADSHNMNGQQPYPQPMYNQNPYGQISYPAHLRKDDHFTFTQQQQQAAYEDMAYRLYVANSQQPVDEFYVGPYGSEYADFSYQPMARDEFGDPEENSTRPRLTKEQVDRLESQFQANHKPNSQVKRQLALETGLSLPRVAVRPS